MTRRDDLIDKLSDQMDPENAARFVDEVINEALSLRDPDYRPESDAAENARQRAIGQTGNRLD
jgi:hypothetical protein